MSDNTVRVNKGFSKYSRLIGTVEQKNGIIPFSNNSELTRNLIFYLSELEQKSNNMFGYIILDFTKFCKQFGYKIENYQRLVENPEGHKIQIMDSKKSHVITNELESCLFQLAASNIPVESRDISGDWGYDFVRIISRLKIAYKPRGNSTSNNLFSKRLYYIKLDDNYKISFLNYFNQTNSLLYSDLKRNHKRSKGLQELYLFLEAKKNDLFFKNPPQPRLSFLAHFDSMIETANIKATKYAERKRKLNTKLKTVQAEAKKIMESNSKYNFEFEFEWFKAKGERFQYELKITFIFTKEFLEFKKQEEKESNILFEKLFKEHLSKSWEMTDKKYDKKKWIENDEIDINLKRKIYSDLRVSVYNNPPSEKLLNFRFKRKFKK